jgi:hypothetical protein
VKQSTFKSYLNERYHRRSNTLCCQKQCINVWKIIELETVTSTRKVQSVRIIYYYINIKYFAFPTKVGFVNGTVSHLVLVESKLTIRSEVMLVISEWHLLKSKVFFKCSWVSNGRLWSNLNTLATIQLVQLFDVGSVTGCQNDSTCQFRFTAWGRRMKFYRSQLCLHWFILFIPTDNVGLLRV